MFSGEYELPYCGLCGVEMKANSGICRPCYPRFKDAIWDWYAYKVKVEDKKGDVLRYEPNAGEIDSPKVVDIMFQSPGTEQGASAKEVP